MYGSACAHLLRAELKKDASELDPDAIIEPKVCSQIMVSFDARTMQHFYWLIFINTSSIINS